MFPSDLGVLLPGVGVLVLPPSRLGVPALERPLTAKLDGPALCAAQIRRHRSIGYENQEIALSTHDREHSTDRYST